MTVDDIRNTYSIATQATTSTDYKTRQGAWHWNGTGTYSLTRAFLDPSMTESPTSTFDTKDSTLNITHRVLKVLLGQTYLTISYASIGINLGILWHVAATVGSECKFLGWYWYVKHSSKMRLLMNNLRVFTNTAQIIYCDIRNSPAAIPPSTAVVPYIDIVTKHLE